MGKRDIEKLQQKLNKLVENEQNLENVYHISEELDELIVAFHKKQKEVYNTNKVYTSNLEQI